MYFVLKYGSIIISSYILIIHLKADCERRDFSNQAGKAVPGILFGIPSPYEAWCEEYRRERLILIEDQYLGNHRLIQDALLDGKSGCPELIRTSLAFLKF